MSQPPLATVEDLETWMGQDLDDDRAGAKLIAASALVRSHTGRTYLTEDDDLIDIPDAVWTVTLMVAERLMTGPTDGVRREGEAIDGYSTDVTYSATAGALVLTDEEKAMLGGTGNRLTSVKVTAPTYPNSTDCWDQILESDDDDV